MSASHSARPPIDELKEVEEDIKLLRAYSIEILNKHAIFGIIEEELKKILSKENPSELEVLTAAETIKRDLLTVHDQVLGNGLEDNRKFDVVAILFHNHIKLINNVDQGYEETAPGYCYERYDKIKEKLKPVFDVIELQENQKHFDILLANISALITNKKTDHFKKPHVKVFITDLEKIINSSLSYKEKFEKTILLLDSVRHIAQGNKALQTIGSIFNSKYENESQLKKDCARIIEKSLPAEFEIQKQAFQKTKTDSALNSKSSQKDTDEISPYQAQQIITDKVMKQFENNLKSGSASKPGYP